MEAPRPELAPENQELQGGDFLAESFPSILAAKRLLGKISDYYYEAPPELWPKEDEDPAPQDQPSIGHNQETCQECGNQAGHEQSKEITQSRAQKRQLSQKYMRVAEPVFDVGIQYLASFDDYDAGLNAGSELLERTSGRILVPNWEFNIALAAKVLKDLQSASHQVNSEIEAVRARGDSDNYQLIKALTQMPATRLKREPSKLAFLMEDPSRILTALVQISGSTLHKDLTAELEEGRYDSFIARDVIDIAVAAPDLTDDVVRIRQLNKFLLACLGEATQLSSADLFNNMALAAAEWPVTEHQMLLECRRDFQNRLLNNYNLGLGDTKYLKPVETVTVSKDFETVVADYMLAYINNLNAQARRSPEIRSALAKAVVLSRRRRKEQQQQGPEEPSELLAATPETAAKLRLIVSCDLKEQTKAETAASLIDQSVKRHGAGADDFREDLENSVAYMARTDLRGNHRRGTKTLANMRVKFEDKVYQLFEFKALEAAGLPTKTELAKHMRIYFIKINSEDPENPYDTFGIVEIGHRSDQAEFLKSIRLQDKKRK